MGSRLSPLVESLELSDEEPWPGLAPFGEGNERFFHGRDAEVAEIVRLLRRETLTVLFGQSGLGKSSLIRAGLFPRVRRDGSLPVYVRLDFSPDAPRLVRQVLEALATACREHAIDAPPAASGQTLWEYFFARRTAFWDSRNQLVLPILAFDQFEEIFTLGRGSAELRAQCEELVRELGDIIEGRPPDFVSIRIGEDPEFGRLFEMGRRGVRVLFGLREDYLPDFEALRRTIPSIMKNRMRLAPMSGEQAVRSILGTGKALVTSEVADAIVRFLAGRRAEQLELAETQVDPAILSVVCRELNASRRARNSPQITIDLLSGGAPERIIADFYDRALGDIGTEVRTFIEDQLLTQAGFRDTYALDDALDVPGVTREAMDKLIARRVIRVEERFGIPRIELTHDVLTRVVKEGRDTRQQRLREAEITARVALQRARTGRLAALAVVMTVLMLISAGLAWKAIIAERAAEQQGRVANSQRLAATARNLFRTEPDLAWLLALEATNIADTAEALKVMREGRSLMPPGLVAYFPRRDGGSDVHAAEFSPDGRVVASGHDRRIRIWRFDDRPAQHRTLERIRSRTLSGGPRLQTTLTEHRGDVTAIAFSPDGRLLASGAANGSIRVWDATTWKLSRGVLVEHDEEQAITAIGFAQDGRHFATASGSGRVAVWDAGTLRLVRQFQASERRLDLVSMHSDGRVIAVDNRAMLFGVSGEHASEIELSPGNPAQSAHFSSNDGSIIATSARGAIYRVNVDGVARGAATLLYDSARPAVRVHPAAGGELVVKTLEDESREIIDLGMPAAPVMVAASVGNARAVAIARDRSQMVVGGAGEMRLSAFRAQAAEGEIPLLEKMVLAGEGARAMALSADGTKLFTLVADRGRYRLLVLDAQTWKAARTIDLPEAARCTDFVLTRNERIAAIHCARTAPNADPKGGSRTRLHTLLVDIENGSLQDKVGMFWPSKDGRRLLRSDGTLWDSGSGKQIGESTYVNVDALPIMLDDAVVLKVWGRSLWRYDLQTMTRTHQEYLPVLKNIHMLVSPEETWIAVVGEGEKAPTIPEGFMLIVLDAKTLEPIHRVSLQKLTGLALRPDKRTFAFVDRGQLVTGDPKYPPRLWKRVSLPVGMSGNLALRYTPDGRHLVLQSDGEPRVALWDLERGAVRAVLFVNQDERLFRAERAFFVPAGDHLVGAVVPSADAGRLVVDYLRDLDASGTACFVARRDLTTLEWNYFLRSGQRRARCFPGPGSK